MITLCKLSGKLWGLCFTRAERVADRWQGAPGVGGMWKSEVQAALLRCGRPAKADGSSL